MLDAHPVMEKFDPWDIVNCKRLAEKIFKRSQQTISRCIGALDGMCVIINKPRDSDVDNPLHYLNRKGFFYINLQAICDVDRKFFWYKMDTTRGTHDSLAFKLSDLGMKLNENGIKKGIGLRGTMHMNALSGLFPPIPSKVAGVVANATTLTSTIPGLG